MFQIKIGDRFDSDRAASSRKDDRMPISRIVGIIQRNSNQYKGRSYAEEADVNKRIHRCLDGLEKIAPDSRRSPLEVEWSVRRPPVVHVL